jgi:hypothetical protein
MGDDDMWDEDIEKQTFGDEFKARERAGVGSRVVDKSLRNIQDPRERFQVQVDAISRSIRDFDKVDISDDDIDTILDKIDVLSHVGYKNATAYILGYLASKGGKKISSDSVNNVFTNVLPHVSDKSVHKEDVIRYARLWINLG